VDLGVAATFGRSRLKLQRVFARPEAACRSMHVTEILALLMDSSISIALAYVTNDISTI
jgi:hypothetical protein